VLFRSSRLRVSRPVVVSDGVDVVVMHVFSLKCVVLHLGLCFKVFGSLLAL
jgi:hypothetical protein